MTTQLYQCCKQIINKSELLSCGCLICYVCYRVHYDNPGVCRDDCILCNKELKFEQCVEINISYTDADINSYMEINIRPTNTILYLQYILTKYSDPMLTIVSNGIILLPIIVDNLNMSDDLRILNITNKTINQYRETSPKIIMLCRKCLSQNKECTCTPFYRCCLVTIT